MRGLRVSMRPNGRMLVAGALVAAGIAAAAAIYRAVSAFINDRAEAPGVAALPAPADAPTGALGALALSFRDTPMALPELRFSDGEGRAHTLADFRGQAIVLNLWATWCVPCRKEMPSLDRLQARAPEIRVLPLSIDRQGLPVVKKFYDELGLASLGIYLDLSLKATSLLNAPGVPTTLLIDREGREIGRKLGQAEWDSPQMVALIREHLVPGSAGEKAER